MSSLLVKVRLDYLMHSFDCTILEIHITLKYLAIYCLTYMHI